jgi:hypothetical protein
LNPVRTPGSIDGVPNKPRTQHRSVRVDDPEWDDLERGAKDFGLDRAKIINQLINWWLGRPGAALPERPSPARMDEIVRARLSRPASSQEPDD